MTTYAELLDRKRVAFEPRGFDDVPALNQSLRGDQREIVDFGLRAGCSANFSDTGLGKSFEELEWARVVVEKTNKPVLMMAPLAVGPQHQREAERFGIDARYIREPEEIKGARVYITNYERLGKFDASIFSGVVLDESSSIKAFDGKRTRELMSVFARTPYRLAATATPAPNDHVELGTHAEFLGVMRRDEMLARWFINDAGDTGTWRLKGHAAKDFWRWVASWARCVTKPSDLGYPDDGFVLPPLHVERQVVGVDRSIDPGADKHGQAFLFRSPEMSATSLHREKRLTVSARADKVAEIVLGDILSCGSRNMPISAERSTIQTKLSGQSASAKVDRETKTKSTCKPTTRRNLKNSSEPANSRIATTPSDEKNMHLTPSSESGAGRYLGQLARIEEETGAFGHSSAFPPPTTIGPSPSKAEDAQSAERKNQGRAANDLQSTTATRPKSSAEFSAQTAIRGSENSRISQIDCGEQQNTSSDPDWWVVWCDTDYEQDELERRLGSYAFSIRGSQSSDMKEALHEAWLRGERKVLITKPRLFGWGLNWQHCHKMIFIGSNYSYESFYQAIRRCWRFGQKREVVAHVVMADTEAPIWSAVMRKAEAHETMKAEMAAAMREAVNPQARKVTYQPTRRLALPSWLREAS